MSVRISSLAENIVLGIRCLYILVIGHNAGVVIVYHKCLGNVRLNIKNCSLCNQNINQGAIAGGRLMLEEFYIADSRANALDVEGVLFQELACCLWSLKA
jgi:hypothetical protein